MKPYKIFLFIVLIIGALAVGCRFFPKDGIKIGNKELHFPSLDDVLAGDQTPDVAIKEIDSVELKHLNDLKDTLQQYREAVTEMPERTRFETTPCAAIWPKSPTRPAGSADFTERPLMVWPRPSNTPAKP